MEIQPDIPLLAYGGVTPSRCQLAQPESIDDCQIAIEHAVKTDLSVSMRGSGCSYSDVALNTGNLVLDTNCMDRILSWDPITGIMVAEPGVTMSQALFTSLQDCWAVASVPGGGAISLGGAVSNDIHGKDAASNGNFGNQVMRIKLLTADNAILDVTREENTELFNAVIGGLGLIGVILEIELQLYQIASSYIESTSRVCPNVARTLEYFEADETHVFSVAWVDCFPKGDALGRGYIEQGDWAKTDRKPPPPETIKDDLGESTLIFGKIPAGIFWKIGAPFFRPLSIRLVNALHYFLLTRNMGSQEERQAPLCQFGEYNFIHKKIPKFYDVFRPQGFIEIQPIIPRNNAFQTIPGIIKLCQKLGMQSLLCAIKRHSPSSGYLSFDGDGYSFGIDIQLRGRNRKKLAPKLRAVYEYIAEIGGKVYLAKDICLERDLFHQMYPEVDRFMAVKDQHDKNRLFQSDAAKRLLF